MKVLVVDDDRDLLPLIAFALERAGFLVVKAADGEQGWELFRSENPDLAVLDINMPGMDGFELAGRLREASEIPILMLTVRGEEEDIVRALETGADDHLAKPFSPKVLVARIRALMRRVGTEPAAALKAGALELDVSTLTLRGAGEAPVRLTPLEARLLRLLLAHAGTTISTERILSHVWGTRGTGNRQLLKQLVHRLRHKIERDPAHPELLQNVPNAGYRIAGDPPSSDQSP